MKRQGGRQSGKLICGVSVGGAWNIVCHQRFRNVDGTHGRNLALTTFERPPPNDAMLGLITSDQETSFRRHIAGPLSPAQHIMSQSVVKFTAEKDL